MWMHVLYMCVRNMIICLELYDWEIVLRRKWKIIGLWIIRLRIDSIFHISFFFLNIRKQFVGTFRFCGEENAANNDHRNHDVQLVDDVHGLLDEQPLENHDADPPYNQRFALFHLVHKANTGPWLHHHFEFPKLVYDLRYVRLLHHIQICSQLVPIFQVYRNLFINHARVYKFSKALLCSYVVVMVFEVFVVMLMIWIDMMIIISMMQAWIILYVGIYRRIT